MTIKISELQTTETISNNTFIPVVNLVNDELVTLKAPADAVKNYIDAGTTELIAAADLALKEYVDDQVSNLVNGAPGVLNTLGEIATALGNDANLAATLAGLITTTQGDVITSNINMKGYVDARVAITNDNVTTAGILLTDYVDTQISTVDTAITTANTAMKGYVDSQISTVDTAITVANTVLKSYVDDQLLNVSGSVSIIAETMQRYVDSQTLSSDAAMKNYVDSQTAVTNVAIDDLGTEMQSYVTEQLSILAANQVNADWAATSGAAQILNKPALFSGSYADLVNTPSIPSTVSELTNDSDFQTANQVSAAIQAVVGAAPAALDTLAEIAEQLANDGSAAAALTTVVGTKAATTYVDTQLALKANASSLADVATTGSYADLTNTPLIPTVPANVSAFTNDSNYQTAAQVNAAIASTTSASSLANVAMATSSPG